MNKMSLVYLAVVICFSGCESDLFTTAGNDKPLATGNPFVLSYEAESYSGSSGDEFIRLESKSSASGMTCVHVGSDTGTSDAAVGTSLSYDVEVPDDCSMGVFEIRYSDDQKGNLVHVYLDDINRGSFQTEDTGTWDDFAWNAQKINLGPISKGPHVLRLELSMDGSWGVIIDSFRITSAEAPGMPAALYNYVLGVINNDTGLARSSDYDDNSYTTLYRNALVAMVFIHEKNFVMAERIFDFFNTKYDSESFTGFNVNWNPSTGDALDDNRWEGDNAFLLLALNYYSKVKGSYGAYEGMALGLASWLVGLASDSGHSMVAVADANTYAALKPFENTPVCSGVVLQNIRDDFMNSKKNYAIISDHIVRGALCFSDYSGFSSIDYFFKTENWNYSGIDITLLSTVYTDTYINMEISAQVLLAWKIWETELKASSIDLSNVETEINKTLLLGSGAPGSITYGLPYHLSYYSGDHGWEHCDDTPGVDPVCYMIFYYWGFNPFAPGQKGY